MWVFFGKCLFLIFEIKCPVTALTWGHNDKRLFVSTGNRIHVGWVSQQAREKKPGNVQQFPIG